METIRYKESIQYKEGFRFQLTKDTFTQTAIKPLDDIITEYIELYQNGFMILKWGYASDGPSGPCRWIADRMPTWIRKKYLKTIICGAFFHDGLYELIRKDLLIPYWRDQSDLEFKRINLNCGMSKARAWWTHKAVSRGGGSAANPKKKKPTLTAP